MHGRLKSRRKEGEGVCYRLKRESCHQGDVRYVQAALAQVSAHILILSC